MGALYPQGTGEDGYWGLCIYYVISFRGVFWSNMIVDDIILEGATSKV